MPANLSPEYHRAEQQLRSARTPEEKIVALEEMLRVIPKHKGTDHMQADRIYAFGYSRGGFTAWYVALYHPDRLAGAVALASGFDVAPGDDGFWRSLVFNVRHVPVLNAWGERDPLLVRDLAEQPAGTLAESNRLFQRAVADLGLPITNIEVPDGVHNQLAPPPQPVRETLRRRRAEDPTRLTHPFRHLFQASCYWLEGLSWDGEHWGAPTASSVPWRPHRGCRRHRDLLPRLAPVRWRPPVGR